MFIVSIGRDEALPFGVNLNPRKKKLCGPQYLLTPYFTIYVELFYIFFLYFIHSKELSVFYEQFFFLFDSHLYKYMNSPFFIFSCVSMAVVWVTVFFLYFLYFSCYFSRISRNRSMRLGIKVWIVGWIY